MIILGIMSGSSLDGIDLALCEFKEDAIGISWKIIKGTTIEYSDEWKERLKDLPNLSAKDITFADYDLGYLFGKVAKEFAIETKVDFIASHGHTVFHEPQKGMTLQIGNGSAIASASDISTIYDFRSMDIGFGGQGAPIVAKLDRDLFSDYDAMVNLGGISNVSFTTKEKTIAYDISPCNQLLNHLAQKIGLEYDKDGVLASKGTVNNQLLDRLLDFDYFKLPFPKSLDNNFIKDKFFPVLDSDKSSNNDKLATCVELISKTLADEIIENIDFSKDNPKVLLAGGGANNKFLVQQIQEKTKNINIEIPDKSIINYKEALLMAYLGYLRVNQKTNVLSTVTGAEKDSIGGAICIV